MGAFYNAKSKLVAWFGNIQIFPYPMFIMFGHSAYQVKGTDVRKILDILEPGDILFRRYNHYISGLLMPGYFTHSGLYTGNDKVVHALGRGVVEEDILTFCRADDIGILRCKDKGLVEHAISFVNNQLGKGYDFDFNTDNADRFYCTELVYQAFKKPTIEMARPVVMPDELFRLPEFYPDVFEQIYKNKI